MASFPLTAELALETAKFLDPLSCFDFAITCKSLWNLFESLITEHRRLSAENRIIFAQEFADGEFGEHPTIVWDKLNEIGNNPRLGWYFRELNLPNYRKSLNEWEDHPNELSEEDANVFVDMARSIRASYSTPDLQNIFADSFWFDDLRRGSDDPIITILVHLLPRLKVFRYSSSGTADGNFFQRLCTALAMLPPHTQLKNSNSNIGITPHIPFRHLTTAVIAEHEEYTEGMHYYRDFFYFFLQIPTLRNFLGRGLGQCWGTEHPRHDPSISSSHPKSNLKEIILDHCTLDIPTVNAITSRIAAIERFSYTGSDPSMSPKRVIQTLSQHASHSLQHLTLECPSVDDNPRLESGFLDLTNAWDRLRPYDLTRISLRPFQVLKTLRCHWKFLWPIPDASVPLYSPSEPSFDPDNPPDPPAHDDVDIRSILPESLEALHLSGGLGYCLDKESKFSRVIDLMCKHEPFPNPLTPNLRQVYICGCTDDAGYLNYHPPYRNSKWEIDNRAELPAVEENPLFALFEDHGYH